MAASDTSFTPNPDPASLGTHDAGTAPAAGAPAADWIERAAGSAHEAIEKVAAKAAPRVRRLQNGLSDAGERLHNGGDELSALTSEWAESARYTVREQPLTALAVAAAVGWLLGRLTR
jgi:ElaB/YqjD/DUF883 family membrane-anchored ribosome-binding protein